MKKPLNMNYSRLRVRSAKHIKSSISLIGRKIMMKTSTALCNYWNFRNMIINGFAVFSVLLIGVSTAEAANCSPGDDVFLTDTKVYPGTMCRQFGSLSTVRYNNAGRVENPSANSSVTVICPIVRDNTVGKWSSIEVVVADRNPQRNVTCRARSNQTDGLGWTSNPSNPLATGFFELEWWKSETLKFGEQSQERDFGTFFVSCTLPPSYNNGTRSYLSGVYSYRVHEYSGCTDPN